MDREVRWTNVRDYFAPQDRILKNHDVQTEVLGIAFDNDSKYIAASYSDGQIRFFLASTARYQTQCNIAQQGSDPAPTGSIKFRPNFYPDQELEEEFRTKAGGKTLLSVSCDGVINHWNALTGKLQNSIRQEDNALFACDYSCDGLKFTAAGKDMKIYLYDELTRQLICPMISNGIKLQGHTNRVFCTKFLPEDPNVVVTGGWDRIMKIYDTRVGRPVGQILGPQVSGDAIDINGDMIVAGSNRHKDPLAVYSLSMRKVVTEIPFDPSNGDFPSSGYVLSCKFSKDENSSLIFAGGAGRNELRVWDNDQDGINKYKELGHLNDQRASIMCIDTANNGKQVAWGNHLGQVFISTYELNGTEEEPDPRTIMGRLAAKRNQERQQTPGSIGTVQTMATNY